MCQQQGHAVYLQVCPSFGQNPLGGGRQETRLAAEPWAGLCLLLRSKAVCVHCSRCDLELAVSELKRLLRSLY